jgi:hypothetical protein
MAVVAEQTIIAAAAIYRVVAAQAGQAVVAASSENSVRAVGANQIFATSAANYECHSILPLQGTLLMGLRGFHYAFCSMRSRLNRQSFLSISIY